MIKRKKITVASTISGSGLVKAGGSNVVYGLYTSMAKYFDVEIIYIAPVNERYRRYEIVPGLTEVVVPKTKTHFNKEKEITEKLCAVTTYDISLMYFLEDTPEYGKALKKSIDSSDLVIIERPYLYYEVRKYLNGRPLFQRSQNIEYYFRKSNIPQGDATNLILEDLFEIEKKCCLNCDLNFACSEEDLNTMHDLYGVPANQLRLLPNGVFCSDNPFVSVKERIEYKKRYGLGNEKIAIFIGGGHRPNIEACEMILNIASFCQDTSFIFAGNLCNQLMKYKLPDNAALLGMISEETRQFISAVSDISLNPMYSGSGSNIKMFDYMACGIPIITTKFGARGISDISSFHIADTADEIITSIENFNLLEEEDAVVKARKLVEEQYDWNVLVQDVIAQINKFTD